MKNMIMKLDRMTQQIASRQRSEIDGNTQNVVAHHIIGRANQYLRWFPDNWFFCTVQQHDLIHRGILKVDNYITPKRMGKLIDKKIESLRWHPTEQFYEETEERLKKLL